MDRAPRNYLKTTTILAIANVSILFSGLYFDWPANTWMLLLMLQVIIGLWIGKILNWLYTVGCITNSLALYAYWALFAMALLSGGGFLTIIQLLVAVTLVMKCTYSKQTSESNQTAEGIASAYFDEEIEKRERIKKKERGVWPVYILSLVLIVSFFMVIFAGVVDTSEFGGLGLFFMLLFLTPVVLIIPSIIKTAVADRVESVYSGIRLLIYMGITASWTIFFMRLFLGE